jgi:hypothetical protein
MSVTSDGTGPDDTSGTLTETAIETAWETDSSVHGCEVDTDCEGAQAGSCGVPHCVVEGEDHVCRYTADDTKCPPKSDCLSSQCSKVGAGYDCSLTIDLEGCEAGQVCDAANEYSCQVGVCSTTQVTDGPTRLTTANDGPFKEPMAAMSPTVVATSTGFAAVYAPAVAISEPGGTNYSYTYRKLKFAKFDSEGKLLSPGWVDIEKTLGFNHPVLLDLGPGRGFVVVYQYWARRHEIGLIELNSKGVVTFGPSLITLVDDYDSFYPDAAFNPKDGAQGRVGIAFLDKGALKVPDKPEQGRQDEIFSRVYDLATHAVVGVESRLSDSSWPEPEVAITHVADGFLVAWYENGTSMLYTRKVSEDGNLGSRLPITNGKSTRPLAMAYNGDDERGQVALAWRAGDGPGSLGVYRMGLLNADGAPLGGGPTLDGVALGPALNSAENTLSHYGKLEVFWNEGRKAFGVCYDAEPTVYNGHAEWTTAMLSYAASGEKDGLVAQKGYALSSDDKAHSLAPTCAVKGATNLVLWNDNRGIGETWSWQGEVYRATLMCE